MTIKVYTVAEQQRILREHMRFGAFRTLALLGRKMHAMGELALERAAAPEAVEKYGDAMFHQSLSELERETWEELADALNRQAVYDARAKGLMR
jgi:hypothetical protein